MVLRGEQLLHSRARRYAPRRADHSAKESTPRIGFRSSASSAPPWSSTSRRSAAKDPRLSGDTGRRAGVREEARAYRAGNDRSGAHRLEPALAGREGVSRRRYAGGRVEAEFPELGEDAARVLVDERQVGALGIDTASNDYGKSKDFVVHRIAADKNVPGLENLTNLDRLPPRGATVIALPIKIEGGSGSPVRVVALVP